MSAKVLEEICQLFRRYMAEGDLESLLSLYDPDVVFLNKDGVARKGREQLRKELAPLPRAQARFDFDIKQVIESATSH